MARTDFDKRIIIYDTYGEFIMLNIKKEEVGRMKFDLEDLDFVKTSSWSEKSKGYAGNKHGRFHRLLLKPPKDMCVDHINRDKLDNRKSNLRICTIEQNLQNQSAKGYYLQKTSNRWIAYISHKGKDLHLGMCPTEEEAKECRRKGELKYKGEYRIK